MWLQVSSEKKEGRKEGRSDSESEWMVVTEWQADTYYLLLIDKLTHVEKHEEVENKHLLLVIDIDNNINIYVLCIMWR